MTTGQEMFFILWLLSSGDPTMIGIYKDKGICEEIKKEQFSGFGFITKCVPTHTIPLPDFDVICKDGSNCKMEID